MAGRKDQAAGSVKKTLGEATGNRRQEAKGAAQEMAGKAKTKLRGRGQAVKGDGRSANRGKLSRAVFCPPSADYSTPEQYDSAHRNRLNAA